MSGTQVFEGAGARRMGVVGWSKALFSFLSFAMFFVGGALIGLLVLPLTFPFALFRVERYRENAMWGLARGYGAFLFWMRLVRLIDYGPLPAPPPELAGKGYVLVANHPTLIDVVFLLHAFPRLTSLVKASWYGSWMFGALLKSTAYLPGPGMPGDDAAYDDAAESPVLRRMVAHLREGHPLVVFPEGTRSTRFKMHRFQRGAFDAAVHAGVPILPVFIRQSPRLLMKGDPFWQLPRRPGRFDFEVLPVIESAGRSGKELRREAQALFATRWEEFVRRELLPEGSVESKSVASSEPTNAVGAPASRALNDGRAASRANTPPPPA